MRKYIETLVLVVLVASGARAAPATVHELIQRSQSGAPAAELKQWLDQMGWPLVRLPDLIQLIRSPVPTVVILELARRSAQHPDLTRIVKVEGSSVYLAGHSRLVILERGPVRTWQVTNRLPSGERMGGPAPPASTRSRERPPAPVHIHIHVPPRRRVREPEPPPRREPAPQIYLFPNPLVWQVSCFLQGRACPVTGPLRKPALGPAGRVPALPTQRPGAASRARPRGVWRR